MTACSVDRYKTYFSSGNKPVKEQHVMLVYESCIMELFRVCPKCTGPATASITHQEGTLVIVSQFCLKPKCGFSRTWSSQPRVGRIAAGNLALSAGTLFSGSLFAKVQRLLEIMKVFRISTSSFFR